jgi:hypothetical protein
MLLLYESALEQRAFAIIMYLGIFIYGLILRGCGNEEPVSCGWRCFFAFQKRINFEQMSSAEFGD